MAKTQANVDIPASATNAGVSGTVGVGSGVSHVAQHTATSPKRARRRPPDPREADVLRILGLAVPVSVVLADRDLRVEAILEMKVGTIIEFDVPFDSDLALFAANRRIGTGQAVKVGENFGLRVAKIGTVTERINALGGADATKQKA